MWFFLHFRCTTFYIDRIVIETVLSMSGRYSTASYPSLILDQFLFFVQLEHQKKRHFGRIRHLEGNLCIFPRIRGKTNTFLLINSLIWIFILRTPYLVFMMHRRKDLWGPDGMHCHCTSFQYIYFLNIIRIYNMQSDTHASSPPLSSWIWSRSIFGWTITQVFYS